jgi:feruloyl esterase
VHVTAITAKAIARAYFDTAPSRSYFVGCSTGGRQGLISAQRFPDDFDGIVVGAPVLDFTGTMAHFAAINRALAAAPMSSERVGLIAERVYAKCDAADGLADGLIDDPRRCQFDVAADLPRCTPESPAESCLTDAQVRALGTVYGGLVSKGATVFPGFPVGAEAFVPTASGRRSGWHPWIIAEGQQTIALQFADSFFKEMVTPGAPIDWRLFDPDRDMDKLDSIGTLLNATDPDLSRFRARGGKILMYFGWADPALNPLMGVDYYEQVTKTMGAGTEEFFRLFMLPGVLHCGGGLGPSDFDSITPLVRWVEEGTAPDSLVATQSVRGKPTRSRLLCPYPRAAKHDGAGDPNAAASFGCR